MDAVKILRSSWIGNKNLSVSTTNNMACKYTLEECINSLRIQIPSFVQDRHYNAIYRNYTRQHWYIGNVLEMVSGQI